MKKRLLALLLTLAMVLSVCSIQVFAEEAPATSGVTYDGFAWSFDRTTGTLTVSGTGAMAPYAISPWYELASQITSVVYEDGITEIDNLCMPAHTNLETVKLPSTLESIPGDMFHGCWIVKEVTIPEGVKSIGGTAFGGCEELTELIIPASVESIGQWAFLMMPKLESVTFLGDAPVFYKDVFQDTTTTVFYPAGNETWTEDVLQNHGGTLTWVPYCAEHNYEAVTTPANCIQDGFTTYTCTYCQDTYTGDYVYATGQHTYTDDADIDCDICGNIRDLAMPTTPMYRMYNPNSGEHFYTGSLEEREGLIAVGWAYEGIAWNAPISSGEPVYRLFNPNNGDHHYTMSADERDMLAGLGWQYEGVCWNSATPDNLPMYRLYNPNADCGSHHYTGSEEERDMLVAAGWLYEGIGWYGMLR